MWHSCKATSVQHSVSSSKIVAVFSTCNCWREVGFGVFNGREGEVVGELKHMHLCSRTLVCRNGMQAWAQTYAGNCFALCRKQIIMYEALNVYCNARCRRMWVVGLKRFSIHLKLKRIRKIVKKEDRNRMRLDRVWIKVWIRGRFQCKELQIKSRKL